MSKENPIGLVGLCFIIRGDDGGWQYQGEVKEALGEGHYLVRFFSVLDGTETTMAVYHISQFVSKSHPDERQNAGSFDFFDDDEHLRIWQDSNRMSGTPV